MAISLAFERLPRRHAEIFVWHHFGKPDEDGQWSAKWTYSELSRWYDNMSFSTITASLKQSAKIMQAAVETAYSLGVPLFVTPADDETPLDFRIWLQFGSESKPRIDPTAQAAVGKIHRRDEAA